jgi:hypothetical protein
MTYYVGWQLSKADRNRLLAVIPPAYRDVIAHHVTLAYDVPEDVALPTEATGQIVGISNSGDGIQALVLKIGNEVYRPDGKVFHITWSLDRAAGKTPADSNTMICQNGWTNQDFGTVTLIPKRFGTT